MTRCRKIDSNSWILVDELPDGSKESLWEGIELYDAGQLSEAEEIFRNLLLVFPDNIDALHHLGLVFSAADLHLESYLCVREAVRIGLDALPDEFDWNKSYLEWGHLDNRPFMRAYHALGIALLARQEPLAATEIFERLVAINPSDNLGARYLLMECYVNAGQWVRAIELTEKFEDDMSPSFSYSRVVALLHCDRESEARLALAQAISASPNVANELLKPEHVRPTSEFPGYFAIGSHEEAFNYWERMGKHWDSKSAARQLLEELKQKRANRP